MLTSGNWTTGVLAAAVLTVVLAWRIVSQGKDASEKLGTVVTKLESLVSAVGESAVAAQQTVEELEKVTAAARQTVEIAAAAREADRKYRQPEHEYRQLEHLRTISLLVQDIVFEAERALQTIPGNSLLVVATGGLVEAQGAPGSTSLNKWQAAGRHGKTAEKTRGVASCSSVSRWPRPGRRSMPWTRRDIARRIRL
jgi:hypothetical protein